MPFLHNFEKSMPLRSRQAPHPWSCLSHSRLSSCLGFAKAVLPGSSSLPLLRLRYHASAQLAMVKLPKCCWRSRQLEFLWLLNRSLQVYPPKPFCLSKLRMSECLVNPAQVISLAQYISYHIYSMYIIYIYVKSTYQSQNPQIREKKNIRPATCPKTTWLCCICHWSLAPQRLPIDFWFSPCGNAHERRHPEVAFRESCDSFGSRQRFMKIGCKVSETSRLCATWLNCGCVHTHFKQKWSLELSLSKMAFCMFTSGLPLHLFLWWTCGPLCQLWWLLRLPTPPSEEAVERSHSRHWSTFALATSSEPWVSGEGGSKYGESRAVKNLWRSMRMTGIVKLVAKNSLWTLSSSPLQIRWSYGQNTTRTATTSVLD